MVKNFIKNYYCLFIILFIVVIIFLPFILFYTIEPEIQEMGILITGILLIVFVVPISSLIKKHLEIQKAQLAKNKE